MKILSAEEVQREFQKKLKAHLRFMRDCPDDPGPWTITVITRSKKTPNSDRVTLAVEDIIVRRPQR